MHLHVAGNCTYMLLEFVGRCFELGVNGGGGEDLSRVKCFMFMCWGGGEECVYAHMQ